MRVLTISALLALAAIIVLPVAAGAKYHAPSPKHPIAYTITTEGQRLTGGGFSADKIYNIEKLPPENYLPNAIYIKTKSGDAFDKNSLRFTKSIINNQISDLAIEHIEAPFAMDASGDSPLANDKYGVSRIYRVHYAAPVDPYDVCRDLMKNPEIEYAVPIFRRETLEYTPNDPMFGNQGYLNNMELTKAWEITKGSKDVTIAIVDSGTDWNHPDLLEQIWTNPNEIPDNGIDDDNNGKIDDIRGWDFVGNVTMNDIQSGGWEEDNDPTNIRQSHGTHVAGCAAASTDNNIGIVSPAFNCSIIPIKCASDNPQAGGIWRGYDAILYAARLGADVINCSWGGEGSSPAEQDVINTAIELGSVVVVASGNDGMNIDEGGQYPAGYENVLCVGATMHSDDFGGFSNYGHVVTTYAPGYQILSTLPNNNYQAQTGTSMASPIVAGVAALVKSVHPDWTPLQIIRQIRSTSDDVLADNETIRPYIYGRTNAFKAVTYNNTNVSQEIVPGVYGRDLRIDGSGSLTDYEPTGIVFEITNYLATTSGLKVKITPLDNYISIDQSEVTVGELTNMASADVEFDVQLLPNNPWFDGHAEVLLTYESDGYKDFQLIRIPIKIASNNKYQSLTRFPTAYYLQWHAGMAPNMNTYWTVGESPYMGGVVYRQGGGNSFTQPTQNPLYCIEALDNSTAWAGDGPDNGNASVYFTTNGGNLWQTVPVADITNFINEIYFFDSDNGIFLGDPVSGRWGVGVTSDGGESWKRAISIPTPYSQETGLVGATWRIGENIWFGTTRGRVIWTNDGGNSWKESTIRSGGYLTEVCFYDELNGIAVYRNSGNDNEDNRLASTTDGGLTWETDVYNFSENGWTPVTAYSPPETGKIILLGLEGIVMSTDNLGRSFTPVLTSQGPIKYCGAGINEDFKVRLYSSGVEVSYLEFNVEPFNPERKLEITTALVMNYDTLDIGSSRTKPVTMKNTGNVPVNINSIEIIPGANTGEKEFSIGFIKPDMVDVDAEENVLIRFRPETEGLKEAELRITTDADTPVKSVQLVGLALDPSSVFEKVTPAGLEISEVMPNPAGTGSRIRIESDMARQLEIYIYNSVGLRIGEVFAGAVSGQREILIPAAELSPGAYYLIIKTNNGNYFRRFTIAR